jgi:PAS domain S-box-containing protein
VNVSQPLVQASLVGEAIDHGPALVLVADEEMSYLAVNQYACDVLGYTREELLGLKVTDVAPGPDTPRAFASFVGARGAAGSIRLRRKNGSELTFEYRAAQTTIAGMLLFVSVGFVADGQRP